MSDLIRQHKMLRILKDINLNKYLTTTGFNFFGVIGELEAEQVEQIPKIWYGIDKDYSLAEATNAFNDFFLIYFSQVGKRPETTQPENKGKKKK